MDVGAWQGRRPNDKNKALDAASIHKKSPEIAVKTGLYDLSYELSVVAIEQSTEATKDASFFFSTA